ncbi:MAG: calcium/sodium antiporter [Pleurocapsa sp.]
MTLTTVVILIGSLILLVVGAELLVNGASKLAAILSISPLIIGLTIVAYGTSAPEMAVSVMSSLDGQADIAVGNAVGSNIFNTLLILGLSSLFTPLMVSRKLIRFEVPIVIGVSFLLLMFGLDGLLSRIDGSILFFGGVVYTFYLIYQSRRQINSSDRDEFAEEYGFLGTNSLVITLKYIGFVILGLCILVVASRLLVDSASAIARSLGVSDLLIGLTIVSLGTSLPELATSVMASIRGERDIAVGNVLGSNIFNIVAVLGVAGIIAPAGVLVSSTAIQFDIPVSIAVAFVCLPIFYSGNRIDRWEGLLFIAYYLMYLGYLILNAVNYNGLLVYETVILVFVIPITVITIITAAIREKYSRQNRKQ